MRILVLQFAPTTRSRPVPRFEPALGTLIALLRERGHEISLIGLSRFDLAAIKGALARGLPQLVYADISAVCTDAARRTFEHILRYEFLPIIAGGQYATVDPAGAVSLPGVHAAALGEPDATLVTYLERVQDPSVKPVTLGVWLRDERGLARPTMPALVEDLDSLPRPDREIFNYGEHVRRTGEVEVAVGRGCPQRCAYCTNRTVAALYEGGGAWVRRRGVDSVIDEIAALREQYQGVKQVRVLDHAFALDEAWLGAFLATYAARVGLPLRCHLRLSGLAEPIVRRLAAAGCTNADVELISGSNFIRNEIFEMDLSDAQVAAGFQMLQAHRVEVRTIVYLGSPYESEASLDDTLRLLKRLRPASVDVRPYFPWPGTGAADLSRESGWVSARGEEAYHAERAGIEMPACKADLVDRAIRRLRREMRVGVGAPWWRRWMRRIASSE